jgi:hypothetical protein
VRTPQSIRNKIVRIIKSYNTAQFRLNTTGAGMVGIEYTDFEEEVVQKHCIYYRELKPILAERPNVTPWATNFDSDEEGDSNVRKEQSSDEESEATDDENQSVISLDNDGSDDSIQGTVKDTATVQTQSVVQLTDDNCTSVSKKLNQTNDVTVTSVSVSSVNNKRKKSRTGKVAPADAKRTQKSLIRQRKKQLCGNSQSKSKSKLGTLLDQEQKERDFMMEARKTKMNFDLRRHNEMKELEINKHNDMKEIEKKKLKLQEKVLKQDEEEKKLKKEHLRAQTEIEKNNLLLVKMQVLEKQIQMRNMNNAEMNNGLDNMFNK